MAPKSILVFRPRAEGCVCWLTTKIGGQQKQRPKGGIPEGGPIPKHRDTTEIEAEVSRKMSIDKCSGAANARWPQTHQ